MSKARIRQKIPHGLIPQIVFAIIITIAALLVLPSTLSAKEASTSPKSPTIELPSAGSVKTSVQEFSAADFAASAYADWD